MSVDAVATLVRVTKRFGATTALDRVDLTLDPGDVACLTGPNGSGKSTLIGLVAGIGLPTSGEVRVGGAATRSRRGIGLRPTTGYLPQRSILYEHLTAIEHLRFLAQLNRPPCHPSRSPEELLSMMGLGPLAHTRTREYSGGSKRKLAILAALAHEPDLLLLDEPLNGVDPAGASATIDLLRDAARRGASVLLATHHPKAFSIVATRWISLDAGRVLADRRAGPVDVLEAPPLHR